MQKYGSLTPSFFNQYYNHLLLLLLLLLLFQINTSKVSKIRGKRDSSKYIHSLLYIYIYIYNIVLWAKLYIKKG